MSDERLEQTRVSWNAATRAHNAHKRDQAAFLRAGGSTLFPEERALMAAAVGPLAGRRLLHLLCNSGQDTLSWAREGAEVTGVDLSDEAVTFARALSRDSGIGGRFVHAEVQDFLDGDEGGYDVAFGSYGCLAWIFDLPRLMRGVRRVLRPGGALVIVEFHPLAWSFGPGFAPADPYFGEGRVYSEPVSDYVAAAGGALSPSGHIDTPVYRNDTPAHAVQHTVADIVTAVLDAGLVLTGLREWPFANGCRVAPDLVLADGGRFVLPEGRPSLPLQLGLTARSGWRV